GKKSGIRLNHSFLFFGAVENELQNKKHACIIKPHMCDGAQYFGYPWRLPRVFIYQIMRRQNHHVLHRRNL
ncbi:MAG: hypothetical protein LIP12_06115, partial [Clostridiales bacterium]|nr:hypothetical protein [Clostridiales bacterium]